MQGGPLADEPDVIDICAAAQVNPQARVNAELAGLAEWWDRFANAGSDEREAMLKPEEGPKPRSRGRGRGRKRRAGGETAQPDGNPPAGEA